MVNINFRWYEKPVENFESFSFNYNGLWIRTHNSSNFLESILANEGLADAFSPLHLTLDKPESMRSCVLNNGVILQPSNCFRNRFINHAHKGKGY